MDLSELDSDKNSSAANQKALIQPARVWAWAFVVLELLLGSVLMLHFLGEKGFWLDEALSVWRAGADLRTLWGEISQHQANMSLYYLLLHFWLSLGKTEFVVRSLSVLFALATIPFVYLLVARLFGQKEGITAALLLTINAFFIHYAQEARGYSLAIFLVAVSSYFFVRGIQIPSPRNWVAYVLASVLSVYAHLFSLLVLIAQFLSLVFLRRRDWPVKKLLASAMITGFLLFPLAIFVLFRDVGQIDWIPQPRLVELYELFHALSGQGGATLLVAYAVAGLVAVCCGLITWPEDNASFKTWRFGFLLTWFFTPILIAFLFSFIKPVFQNRYLVISLPPFVILVAVGLARIRHWQMFITALAVIVFLSAGATRQWYLAPEKQYWRSATNFVVSRAKAGDAILFYVYYGKVPFEYYVGRLGNMKNRVDVLELASGPWIAGNLQPDPSQHVLNELNRRYSRVWLVRFQDGSPPGHPLKRYEQGQLIQQSLMRQYVLRQNVSFVGGIRVQLYEGLMKKIADDTSIH
jgi:mannosyltransferase